MKDNIEPERADSAVCAGTGLMYHDIAESVFDAFIAEYYNKGTFRNADFWDNAEIFEAVVDAYEQTDEEKYLQYIKEISSATIEKNGQNWQVNIYNDDIMWLVIAYTRSYLLTGNTEYLNYAIENFNMAFNRSYSDDLGGGLWWRTDNQCKNSCICCPGSIAACLIGKATGEESYFKKAATVMKWEIENLFEPETGKVYDCMNIDKTINTWSSTYNQGTFIGACNLLYDHTKDEKYLRYAGKAAGYAVNTMFSGGIMNSESSGNDLIGFKGILTRWLYRYAKFTDNSDILNWLQLNAAAAWSNRNSKGLIWTTWNDPTDETSDYDVFGMSPAVALMFNCQLWKLNSLETKQTRYNAETLTAMQETRDIVSGKIKTKSYSTLKELLDELDTEISDDVEYQPNAETTAAMLESEKIANDPNVKGYNDINKLLADLKE